MAKKKRKSKRPAKKKAGRVKKQKPKTKKAGPKVKPRPKSRKKKTKQAKALKKKPLGKKRSGKKAASMAKLLLPLGRIKEIFRTRYGFFLYDGSEFVINTPETPSPWSNILTNGDYGMVISQSGCGMSFQGGIGNRITRWEQDNSTEKSGKFIYIRDNQSQEYWSATWKPVCKTPEFYEVRHGIGYTNISSKNNGIISSLIYYVAADEPVEVWQMRIKNITDQPRFLSVFSYLEWDFGTPSGNREYDKFFVDTAFDDSLSAVFASTPDNEHAFHSVNHKVQTFTCGRESFLGSYRDVSNPRCVEKGMCFEEQGRYNDPAAALQIEVELPPQGEKELIFTLGKCSQRKDAQKIIRKYKNVNAVEEEFSRTGHRWTIRLGGFQMTTPDEGANILTNKWFRYQTMSAGLASFGSCYEPYGKVRFKDYLINGLVLLSVNPKHHRQFLLSCAEKQFEDGSVIDEWDPKSGKGSKPESLEAPLWLVYSLCEYLKETYDTSLLEEEVKFQDAAKKSMFIHCKYAINRVFTSIGKKGLPPVCFGDHMEKLDGTLNSGKGESVWLAQFLAYIIDEFMAVCRLKNDKEALSDYENRLKKLKDKIRKLAFNDGQFLKALSHTGKGIGTSKGRGAGLFLDTQVWAVIAGTCEASEVALAMDKVNKQLYKEHGPVVICPSFSEFDEEIGTLSRIPKGVMENAGVSLETACWAIWAEVKLGNAQRAWAIYAKLDPVDRSHKSDVYRLEPFVSCKYVDGPESPAAGRARYSWYNRSGYWMFKVMAEEILGIKPTYEGLLISPCIPSRWKLFKVRRTFRNAYYTIEVVNPRYVSQGIAEVAVDGKKVKSNLIPSFGDDKRHHVKVVMGKKSTSA